MHGLFYELSPLGWAGSTWGVRPISQHLRMIPDFTSFRGFLVLGGNQVGCLLDLEMLLAKLLERKQTFNRQQRQFIDARAGLGTYLFECRNASSLLSTPCLFAHYICLLACRCHPSLTTTWSRGRRSRGCGLARRTTSGPGASLRDGAAPGGAYQPISAVTAEAKMTGPCDRFDNVSANQPSDPYLMTGFDHKVRHVSNTCCKHLFNSAIQQSASSYLPALTPSPCPGSAPSCGRRARRQPHHRHD